MRTPVPPTGACLDYAARRRLVARLRVALIPVLTEGSWAQIEDDHRKIDLPWRGDLQPGWGKPKYVERVLDDLKDEEVVAVARRALERFPERCAFAVEDALLWVDADGVAQISEVTRLALAKALEGRRLHPEESPDDSLSRLASSRESLQRFEYSEDGTVCAISVDPFGWFTGKPQTRTTTTSSHLALLDAYKFREWPDARLFQLLEFLAHPAVRNGEEQQAFVQAINGVLAPDRFRLVEITQISGHPVYEVRPSTPGVAGRPKNLIFASTGPKPELGFVDAVNNDIIILRHGEHCLVYEESIAESGLRWPELVQWWAARDGLDPANPATRRSLAERLTKSLGSEAERRFFNAYFKAFRPRLGDSLPALVPQVYLHYDPLTIRELRARGDATRFDVQRMDFLLLLPHGTRIVIEIDGQQHYSTGLESSAKPSPEEYARTIRGDRHLRLAGYEVFRFGGHELRDDVVSRGVVDDFFTRLFRRHKLAPSS